jgi:hypothetical protein
MDGITRVPRNRYGLRMLSDVSARAVHKTLYMREDRYFDKSERFAETVARSKKMLVNLHEGPLEGFRPYQILGLIGCDVHAPPKTLDLRPMLFVQWHVWQLTAAIHDLHGMHMRDEEIRLVLRMRWSIGDGSVPDLIRQGRRDDFFEAALHHPAVWSFIEQRRIDAPEIKIDGVFDDELEPPKFEWWQNPPGLYASIPETPGIGLDTGESLQAD